MKVFLRARAQLRGIPVETDPGPAAVQPRQHRLVQPATQFLAHMLLLSVQEPETHGLLLPL
jgi:hypothetical protein